MVSTLFKMWQLPILVLTAVIISSTSQILDPININPKLRGTDNTLYYNNKDINKSIFCNILANINNADIRKLCKELTTNIYGNTDNNNIVKRILKDIEVKTDLNYNGKGYRKEQWHNYPRQLDRLQSFLYKRHEPDYGEKEYVFEDDPQINDASKIVHLILNPTDNYLNTFETNEMDQYNVDSNDDNILFDSIIAANNPLMVLKLQLASASDNNRKEDVSYADTNVDNVNSLTRILLNMDRINPTKVLLNNENIHWHGNANSIDNQNEDGHTEFKELPSKKRMFSIWSRVQSMSPKGHELHHRRFLHAYYAGLPTADGSGGIVSAETRALTRPPGSPLRWG